MVTSEMQNKKVTVISKILFPLFERGRGEAKRET
jgi:hypothetical protein